MTDFTDMFIGSMNEYQSIMGINVNVEDISVLREILFEWHPYNYISLSSSSSSNTFAVRDDFYLMFRRLNLADYILDEFRRIHMRKCVKKSIGVFAVTISPEITDQPNKLVECVKKITMSKCVENLYGVFEYGRNRHNFHTHFVVSFTDRNGKRNLTDSIKKKYKIYKIEEMGGPTHLLKTLRYFHKEDKVNRGIINKESISHFEDISEGDAPIKFTQDLKEKIYNIN